jgi:hypothetical protein
LAGVKVDALSRPGGDYRADAQRAVSMLAKPTRIVFHDRQMEAARRRQFRFGYLAD